MDVSSLPPDSTRDAWLDLQEGGGRIHLLLTLSGLTDPADTLPEGHAPDPADLPAYEHPDRPARVRQLHWRRSLADFNDVGHLEVKVYAARGLLAADLGGKSDPYAVLELDNTRLQTHTVYKTVSPVWNRNFVFPVRDLHSTLFITVYDDDSKHT